MIKPLIILFNTLSVFLFSFFFGESTVTVTGNFPKTTKVNTEFVSEVVINKGTIGGFAKFQLEVPQGFTVKEMENKGGNFSFSGNIAKIIWTAIPNDPEFTVKFIITADASAQGLKTITSKFSFINNNLKEVVEMIPAEINVGDGNASTSVNSSETPVAVETKTETPSTNSITEVPVVTNTSEKPGFDNPTEPNSSIVCKRTISKGAIENEYNVDVKIKKGSIKGFAKYQEVLPSGYSAKSVITNGSSFSVSDGKAKFVWVSLPADEELLISYILEKSNLAASDSKLENGEFSYLENDQSKKTKMPTELISDITNTNNAVSNTQVSNLAETNTVASTQSNTSNTQTVTEVKTTDVTNINTVAKKEGNVLYCVQIGAFKAAIPSETLAKKFNINETIKSEMAEGFSKFMIGSFNEYKQARSQREIIKQKGCSSAFVAAYNSAKRITVQEALMITSQKWFK